MNSFDSKMDRIRPEKLPRHSVQKVWRNVRWAKSFPDDSLTVESTDITPTFALRKVAILFENKKYSECASLIRRLSCITLSNILQEIPIDVLLDSFPQSLNIVEALYVKLFEVTEDPSNFPKDDLKVDAVLQKLVALFARQSRQNTCDKNPSSLYPACRSILNVIAWVQPNVRKFIRMKKKSLDNCIRHLGKHGLVESSEGTLMNLHDSFKIEFEKEVQQYRNALQTLEELNLSVKHPTGSSLAWGPAPSSSSHHRMMQITHKDVQDRIIKNRTLYNIIEPAITNQYLHKFIHILEKRIEYDKMVLFHDTELRKIGETTDTDEQQLLSVNLKEFSEGYSIVLQLLKEVIDEEAVQEDDEGSDVHVSSDEETISPLMYTDKLRSLSSINGVQSLRSKSGGSTSQRQHRLRGRSFTKGIQPSIIPIGETFRHGNSNGYNHGNISGYNNELSLQWTQAKDKLPISIGKRITVGDERTSLDDKFNALHIQVAKDKEMIKSLQEREKQHLSQISQLQLQLQSHQADKHKHTTDCTSMYHSLFWEHRKTALDYLETLTELQEVPSLKVKILFSVVVLAFRSVQQYIQEFHGKLRYILNLPIRNAPRTSDDPVAMEMQNHIDEYLCHTSQRFDMSQCVHEVSSQICSTLYDYPCLKSCDELKVYIDICVNTAWQLSVHIPPYQIVYDSRIFNSNIHTRNATSDIHSVIIKSFYWPALIQANDDTCVQKGIVET